jgi:hypothetical protein
VNGGFRSQGHANVKDLTLKIAGMRHTAPG